MIIIVSANVAILFGITNGIYVNKTKNPATVSYYSGEQIMKGEVGRLLVTSHCKDTKCFYLIKFLSKKEW
jgi:hypothetical protein